MLSVIFTDAVKSVAAMGGADVLSGRMEGNREHALVVNGSRLGGVFFSGLPLLCYPAVISSDSGITRDEPHRRT